MDINLVYKKTTYEFDHKWLIFTWAHLGLNQGPPDYVSGGVDDVLPYFNIIVENNIIIAILSLHNLSLIFKEALFYFETEIGVFENKCIILFIYNRRVS